MYETICVLLVINLAMVVSLRYCHIVCHIPGKFPCPTGLQYQCHGGHCGCCHLVQGTYNYDRKCRKSSDCEDLKCYTKDIVVYCNSNGVCEFTQLAQHTQLTHHAHQPDCQHSGKHQCLKSSDCVNHRCHTQDGYPYCNSHHQCECASHVKHHHGHGRCHSPDDCQGFHCHTGWEKPFCDRGSCQCYTSADCQECLLKAVCPVNYEPNCIKRRFRNSPTLTVHCKCKASVNQTSTTSKTISTTETSAAAITKIFPITNSSSSLTLAAISNTYESLANTGSTTVSTTRQTTVLNSSKSTRTATSTSKTSLETTQSSPTTTVVTSPIASSSISTSTSTSVHAVISSLSSKSATNELRTTYSTTSPPSTKVTTKASTKHIPSPTQLAGNGHFCHQCGDITSKTPCSQSYVSRSSSSPCITGSFCQNDLYIDSRSQIHVYKRCVDKTTCIHDWLMMSSDKEYCVRYGRTSKSGPYRCSFCCMGNDCNANLIPSNTTLFGLNG